MNDFFTVLGKFIRVKIVIVFSYLIFFTISTVIFFLYDIELEAILYAFAMCSFIGFLIITISFLRYYKKHKKLQHIANNIKILSDKLPRGVDAIEEDYQNMVSELAAYSSELSTSLQQQRSESIDYYTTWVHQIKTPISVMRMILQSEDSPVCKELQFELFRIEEYVDMVLSYFRLDTSASDFIFKDYELDKIIKQSVRKYASQFIRRKIKLEYAGTDKVVLTDQKWLSFIIEQLLSNSIKYTPFGTVKIFVGENSVLSIEDTGIGIADEDIPRIFEKGFTGYNGRENKKSTGLGLYLCKQASEKLSHKIWAESKVGEGTKVYLDLRSANLEVE